MSKQLSFDQDARAALKRGVEKVARAVRPTLGPKGRNVVLDKGWGAPNVTSDGATVAEEIELIDPYENAGAQVIKQAASKTNDQAGDGTTTATILGEALFLGGLRAVTAGADPMAITRGFWKGTDAVVEDLKKLSRPVATDAEILQIATVSAHDEEVGKLIADAMKKVGKDGVITIEDGKQTKTEVKIVEGMQFDRGFLSPHFVTDPDAITCVLENPYILIHEEKISSVPKLIPLLEKAAEAKHPLLIIAEDIEGEALATLVVNRLRGILNVCAVKAPGYGDRRKAMLEDIAILTGGKPIFKDLGIDLEQVKLGDLGQAEKVTISAEFTTIVKGRGKATDVAARAAQIKREAEESDSDYDREKLQERMARLTAGVAQVQVGATTEMEMKEKKYRIEDALHATRAAVEEGVVPGGGVALLRAQKALDGVKAEGDEKFGVDILRKALEIPLRTIAENSGRSGAVVVAKVRDGKDAFGYDGEADRFGDLFGFGVMDPTKVTRTALVNGTSSAAMLLSANCIIVEAKEDKKEPTMGGEEEEFE